jgi:uncharacterized protein (DUF1697 family)
MVTYIALLRGINVGGHVVKMDVLRRLFADLGLANVRSYIQTGNLFFDGDEEERSALRRRIEAHLQPALGYAVPVCLRTVEELERVVALDPFTGVAVTPDVRLSVTFLAEPVAVDLPVPSRTPKGDFELVGKTDRELFVVWHLSERAAGQRLHGY